MNTTTATATTTLPEVKTLRDLRKALKNAPELMGSLMITGKGSDLEVELENENDMVIFCAKVAKWGGYRTGYGAWVMRPNHKPMGDFNHPGSCWHL